MRHIFKVLKQLDKYLLQQTSNPSDNDLRKKIESKIPLFEKAIQKLKERKAMFKFQASDSSRSMNQKADFTLAYNSTMNEYSNIEETGRENSNFEDLSYKNFIGIQDSFTKSVKTLFNSIKTDNFSRQSDQSIFNGMKQKALVNNESFIDQKLQELEEKLQTLKRGMF
jgi:DNA mismatch repair ATPase MutS